MYYRGAVGVIVVYDITSKESFEHVDQWLNEVRKSEENVKCMIVGNKIDCEKNRRVKTKTGEEYANEKGAMFGECSACTGENVKEVFERFFDAVVFPPEEKENETVESLQLNKSDTSKQSNCC